MKPGSGPGAFDSGILLELVRVRMPFGKYTGRVLCDLPEPYLVWFERNGYPPGRLGVLLAGLREIKLNGLEYLLKPLREGADGLNDGARGARRSHRNLRFTIGDP